MNCVNAMSHVNVFASFPIGKLFFKIPTGYWLYIKGIFKINVKCIKIKLVGEPVAHQDPTI